MRRQEAVRIVKEVVWSCKLLNPSGIILECAPSDEAYEIHVKASVDNHSWECLKKFAKKHALGLKLIDNTVVIYSPPDKKALQPILV